MTGMDLSHVARRDVFSAAMARAGGYDSDAIAPAVAQGQVHPLFRGWYALRSPVDDSDWNRLAARAAYLRFDGRAMVSHQSALFWHGLPVVRSSLRTVHVTRTIAGSSRSRTPVRIHRAVPGVPVADRVPIAVAVVQSGLTGTSADRARCGRLRPSRRASRPDQPSRGPGPAGGSSQHRSGASHPAGSRHRIESPGESILGHRLRQLGWEVVPQFEVETDQGPRFADFRIPGTRVLIEFDGLVKYRGEDGADAVVAEKVREDAMRRRGFLFARFIWSELDDLHLIDRRVREQVDESAAA
jgi:very-short-patch-repair endonuclease